MPTNISANSTSTKNSKTRWIWTGKVVHETIEEVLKEIRTGTPNNGVNFYHEKIMSRMRSEDRDSKLQKYFARFNRFLGLTVHHYHEEMDDEEWKIIHLKTVDCFSVFWNS